MIPQPLTHTKIGDEWGWKVDKGWKLVGWTPNPGWQGREHRAGIMFESEDGTDEAWFHWEECYLWQLPQPNDQVEARDQ